MNHGWTIQPGGQTARPVNREHKWFGDRSDFLYYGFVWRFGGGLQQEEEGNLAILPPNLSSSLRPYHWHARAWRWVARPAPCIKEVRNTRRKRITRVTARHEQKRRQIEVGTDKAAMCGWVRVGGTTGPHTVPHRPPTGGLSGGMGGERGI